MFACLEGLSFVVSYVVCEIVSYMFAFRDFSVFGKCFLMGQIRGPIIWSVACLRASVVFVSCGVVCVCAYWKVCFVVGCWSWLCEWRVASRSSLKTVVSSEGQRQRSHEREHEQAHREHEQTHRV